MKSRHLLSNIFEEIWLVYFTRLALLIDDSEKKLFKFNLIPVFPKTVNQRILTSNVPTNKL